MRRVTILAVLVALAGCPQNGQQGGGTSQPTDKGFKVALLTPGPISDKGWNALAWDGLKKIEKELGASVEHIEQHNPAKFEDDLRDFAQRGAKVVIAHGYEFQDACEKAGARFPDTVFLISAGQRPFKNGIPMDPRLDEACYLAGILAAHVTKTKKLAAVGGMAIPTVKDGFVAFGRAAKRAKADVALVDPAYLGTWDDVAKGKEQALAFIAAGADVVLHNADHAGLGVFDACREKGVLAIGSNRDQNSHEPKTIVASAIVELDRCMLDLAREVKDGKLRSRKVVLDMKSGYVDLRLNEGLKDLIPAQARQEIADARAAILAGKLDPLKD